MEATPLDSVNLFDGGLPQMGPMLESVWLTIGPAVVSERALRGKINIVSNRVGAFTDHEMWVHQCRPRAIYSRLRNHALADASQYPRARFALRISDPERVGTMGAQLLMNGKLVVSPAADQRPSYTWHWLRALASFFTCTNPWEKENPQCQSCHKWLTKQEFTLLSLNILGRKLNGRIVA